MGLASMPGMLGLSISANYTLHDERQDAPDAPVEDWTGLAIFGNFRWQAFTSVSYSVGRFSSSLRWRHYPAVDNFDKINNPETRIQGVGSYNIYDLSGSYAVTGNLFIRAGIDNLLDIEPPINGYNPGVAGPGSEDYDPGMLATGFVYDPLGRRYYLGVKVTL